MKIPWVMINATLIDEIVPNIHFMHPLSIQQHTNDSSVIDSTRVRLVNTIARIMSVLPVFENSNSPPKI